MLLTQLPSSLCRCRFVACASETGYHLMLTKERELGRIAFGRFLGSLKQLVLFTQARVQGRNVSLILLNGVNKFLDFLCSLLDSRQTRLLVSETQVLLLRLLPP